VYHIYKCNLQLKQENMIIQPDDADPASEGYKWALLTVQPRPAAGSLPFTEIPVGMLDDNSFSAAAAKEVEEEISIKITEEELMNMSVWRHHRPPPRIGRPQVHAAGPQLPELIQNR
jgi:8-oxo-dGTP pyrophosphatase MutT (NUDIX family)